MSLAVRRFPLSRRDAIGFVGISGLYLFSFSGGFSTAGINVGLWLMILGFLADREWIALDVHKTTIARAVVIFTAYVLGRAIWTGYEFPLWQEAIIDDAKEVAAIGGLGAVIVAWWLHRDRRTVYTALSLALAGLIVGFLYNLEWHKVSAHMAGLRATFGLGNNGPGLYGSAAILGLAVLGLPAVWRSRPPFRYVALLLVCLMTALLLIAVFWNQSRSSWLAAGVITPLALAAFLVIRRHLLTWRLTVVALSAALVVFTAAVMLAAPVIEKRLHQEQRTVSAVLHLELEDIPRTSIGHRIRMWQFAAGVFSERPVFGWGPGTAKMLMEERGFYKVFGHFHNIYVHFLVEFGVIGFLMAGGVVVLLLSNLVRRNDLGEPYLIFTLGAVSMLVIASLFQIRYDDPHGMFYMILLGALMLSGFYPRADASGGTPP